MSSIVCIHSWQISKELLGICLPSLQRAWLTDRNAGVQFWKGGCTRSSIDKGTARCERGSNLHNLQFDTSAESWCSWCNATLAIPDVMWGDFGLCLRKWTWIICVGALGLSVKSCLAVDDREKAFVTAQTEAVPHHSTQGWDRENQAPNTGTSKIIAPLSVEGQIGGRVGELTLSRAMCHSHHVHSQHLIFHVAGEEPAWTHR